MLSALQKASAKLAASGKLPAGKTADVVNDTATLSNAFETINTGQGFTDEQALAVAKSFKSDASTTGYIELAATISQFLVPFVNSLVQQGLPPAEVQAQTTQVLTNLSPAVQAGVISVAPTTYELRAIGRDDAGALVYLVLKKWTSPKSPRCSRRQRSLPMRSPRSRMSYWRAKKSSRH